MSEAPIQDAEAEGAVIGAVLIDPERRYDMAFLEASDFFIVRHRWIWSAIQRLHARGDAIDYMTVVDELQAHDQLEEAGGPVYITHLINNTPISRHAETYARIVQRSAYRRRLLDAIGEIAILAHDETTPVEELHDRARAFVDGAAGNIATRDIVTMFEAVGAHVDKVVAAQAEPEAARGIPTGYGNLDGTFDILRASKLVTVAGRPGMGKTSLMLNWASGAWRTGARVAFFSLEMDTDELMDRIAAAKTGISSRKFGSGTLDENERRRYNAAIDELAKWRGYFDDASAETLPGLDAKCRRLMNANGLDLVFVDYLQLVSSGQRANNRVEEVSQITVGLKRLARSLRIPIVVGAQLSREVKNRSNKRPELTDLRESGSIEQDSDIVIMLHRDSYYNADAPPGGETELLIRKYRNGPTGIVKLIFEAETTRFVEVAERLRTWWDGM